MQIMTGWAGTLENLQTKESQMDLPTKMTEAAVSQRVPAAKQTQEHDCTLCQELVDNSQPGIFYSQLRYSPWMPNKTVKNTAMKSRAPCVAMCHTKERKDLLLRVYLMLLVKLVLCLIFCTVFSIWDEVRSDRIEK
nr:hypothetical protein BgiMline_021514 [Biomphalaria glabrata]